MIEFKLPSLGADMDKGKLLEWRIKPGDTVHKGQVVAVVDTSKAAIDLEIWQEGIVERLLTQPDQTIAVGTVMALLRAREEAPSAVEAAPVATSAAPASPPSRRRISPAARQRAEALGVDLEQLGPGSGPDGAVTIEDVERAAATVTTAPADRSAAMRQTIAAAMSRSKREIPHYYLTETIPLQRVSDWLRQANAQRPLERRLLMAVPLLKAVAQCLRRFPDFNGHYRDGRFQPADHVHPGVAIALRGGGLIAPALHDVDRLDADALMAALSDLIRRARAGSLRSSELADATVTVTSLGEQGSETVLGVIYPPQVALVGFGRVGLRPWAEPDGSLRAVPCVTASLAADHRVSDGHRGAQFLAALAAALQQPEAL